MPADSLGREFGSSLSPQAMAEKMLGPTKQTQGAGATKSYQKLMDNMRSINKEFDSGMKSAHEWVEEMKKFVKELNRRRAANKEKRGKQPESKEVRTMSKAISELYKLSKKKGAGSLQTHDVQLEKAIKELHKKSRDTASGGGGGSSGGGGGGGGSSSSGGGGGGGARGFRPNKLVFDLDDLYFTRTLLFDVENQLRKVEEAFFGFQPLTELISGLVSQETQFTREVRATAYEIAGVTGEARGLQRAYEDIGTVSKITGKNRTEVEQTYLATLKKGIKDQKMALAISTTQLNVATMLGLKGEELGETFAEWHEQFRMNSGQLSDMARGLRDIARFSGVTGKNLVDAVKAGEDLVRTFQNAATLSSTMAKNALELVVNAKKFGVDQQFTPILKAMSSTTVLLNEASDQQKTLLFQAAGSVGRIDELMNGTILRSKAGIKDMAQGLENVLQQFGVASFDDIDNLSDSRKRDINLQLKSAFGVELGELQQMFRALEDSSKTTADRLAEINRRREQNLTLEEKASLLEEERRLKTSSSLEMLTALDEAAKGASSMEQALAKFGTRREEFEADLLAIGGTWGSNSDAARSALSQAAGGVGMKLDPARIEEALSNPVAFRELTAEISKAEQEAAIRDKTALDPISDMAQTLHEINDNLRSMSQGMISAILSSFMGLPLVLGTAIASGLLQVGLKGIGTAVGFEQLYQGLQFVSHRKGEDGAGGGLLGGLTGGGNKASTAATGGAVGKGGISGALKGVMPDLGKGAGMLSGSMVKTAGQLLLFGTALFLLGTAIVVLGGMVMKAFNLDAKQVLDTVLGVVAILGGAAAIAAAVLGAVKGLELLNQFVSQSKGLASTIFRGGATLLILAPAITLLAGGLLFITKSIMGMLGMDSGKSAAVAKDLGIMLAATGAIAGAVLLASGALALLGLLAQPQVLGAVLPPMLAGAGILMVMAPAITLLAAGLMLLVDGVMSFTGMKAKQAAEVADNLGGLLWSAGKIALSVLAAAAGLTALGWLAPVAYPLIGPMMTGTWVLFALTPVITALATALVYLTGGLLSMLPDPAEGKKTAEGLATLLSAAGSIAWSILSQAAALSLLGLMAVVVTPMIALMELGAISLLALSGPATLISLAILRMTEGVMKYLPDPKQAGETATAFANVLKAAADISWAILSQAVSLSALGLMLPLVPMLNTLMGVGAVSLFMLSVPATLLSMAIIKMAEKFASVTPDPKAAGETAKSFADVLTAASDISWAILSQTVTLSALGLMVGLAPTLAALMYAGSVTLSVLSGSVAMFVRTMMNVGENILNEVDPSEAGKIVGGLETVMELVRLVPKFLTDLNVTLGEMTGGILGWITSPLKSALSNTRTFEKYFVALAESLRTGIIKPISHLFESEEELENVKSSMKMIGGLFDEVTNMMDSVGSKIAPLLEPNKSFLWIPYGSKLDDAVKNMEGLKGSFGRIAGGITENVIRPLRDNLPSLEEVSETLNILKKLSEVFIELKKTIDQMGSAEISDAKMETAFRNMTRVKYAAAKAQSEFGTTNRAALTEFGPAGAQGKMMSGHRLASDADMMLMANRIQPNSFMSNSSISGFGGSMIPISHALHRAEAMNGIDVHADVEREHAGQRASGTRVASPDLSRMAESNDQLVALQSETVSLLQQLLDHFDEAENRTANSGGDRGDTATKFTSTKPPTYFKWTTGKHNQNADKNVNNIGSQF